MRMTPKAVQSLVGCRQPEKGELLDWVSPEAEAKANQIIEEALELTKPRLASIWIGHQIEGQTLAGLGRAIGRSRERCRQLHNKAKQRLIHVIIQMDGLRGLRKSIEVRYIPDGPCDPSLVNIVRASKLTGLTPIPVNE